MLPPAMDSPLNGIFQQSFFQSTDSRELSAWQSTPAPAKVATQVSTAALIGPVAAAMRT